MLVGSSACNVSQKIMYYCVVLLCNKLLLCTVARYATSNKLRRTDSQTRAAIMTELCKMYAMIMRSRVS
jgi:hypothetical protein